MITFFATNHDFDFFFYRLVEGHDQFSFKRIPYAVAVMNSDRWTHSSPMTKLEDCHEGKKETLFGTGEYFYPLVFFLVS